MEPYQIKSSMSKIHPGTGQFYKGQAIIDGIQLNIHPLVKKMGLSILVHTIQSNNKD